MAPKSILGKSGLSFGATEKVSTIIDADKQAHLQRAWDEQAKAVKTHYELKPWGSRVRMQTMYMNSFGLIEVIVNY